MSQRAGANGEVGVHTWARNCDFVENPGVGATFSACDEDDLSNFDTESAVGSGKLSVYHFYGGTNPYPNLAFHYFGNATTFTYSER